MRAISGFFASFGVLAFLIWLGLIGIGLCLTVYGLYLAFSASIIIGILALVLEPSPFVIGLIMVGFHYNIPQHILHYLSN